jgi:FKBP-type peptidyl-prolyl cis-trans isomerase
MRITTRPAIAAIALACVPFVVADEPAIASKPTTPASGAPATPAFTDAQLAEALGWILARQFNLSDLGFSTAEAASIIAGFSEGVQGRPLPYDVQKIGPEVGALMRNKQGAFTAQLRTRNLAQAAAFFTDLKKNKAVVELPSGLRYEILKAGDGPGPKPTDTVRVNYTGTFIDGTVFDSSVQTGRPAEFILNKVIPGWTEGIQKIGKGGRIRLYVPPDLAYGDEGRPGIPPASTLIFDVELLDSRAAASP